MNLCSGSAVLHLEPALTLFPLEPARPEGVFDVRAGDAPPPLGGRLGCYAGSPSRGYPGYARDRARVGERADRRQDPELPRGLLPDHPRLSPVAAGAAGPLARG